MNTIINEKRTRRIHFVMYPSDYERIKSKASKFKNLTDYIMCALNEFSDKDSRDKVLMGERLADYYLQYRNNISHIGANLNQAIHHCNIMAKGDSDLSSYFINEVIPMIEECRTLCSDLKESLRLLTKEVSL